jgi:DNA-binding FrmR family transcriptional regulator
MTCSDYADGGSRWGDPRRPEAANGLLLQSLRAKHRTTLKVAFPVSHAIREKTKLLNRVRRIRGQLEAVERALEQEIGCADVLQLITGALSEINGLMGEVIEDHIRVHLIDPALHPGAEAANAAEELIEVVRSYLK